ncbi:winged helix-turn-helix transcriptional regulator [Haloarchaeobius baliensis]|uniref:winged helix-turn-helix transcriptional regulator n=1 Tax=Haloarchaeobius baliensis TaxID=1670458 RepID=UPI003F88313F
MSEQPATTAETDETDREPPRCYCPLGGVMDLLSRKYAMQLVCIVGALGPVRYGEIEDAFGDVSSSTLSTRLDELAAAGYLSREQYDEIPPRVEYELTDDGLALCRRLEPLLEWAEEQDRLH